MQKHKNIISLFSFSLTLGRNPRHYSKMPLRHLFIIILFIFAFSSCGGWQETPVSASNPYIIIISNKMFIPSAVTVSAGDVIYFDNQDDMPHIILSQSAEDLFDDDGTFASDLIPENTVGAITVPATATAGTTLYFYDDLLKDVMLTPNGSVLVE